MRHAAGRAAAAPRSRTVLVAFALLAALGAVAAATITWAVWSETDARSALDEAFDRPIGAARVILALHAWADEPADGRRGLRVLVDGPVSTVGAGRAPELDWRVRAGELPAGRRLDARVRSAGGRTTVTIDGVTQEVSRPLFAALVGAVLRPPGSPTAGGDSPPAVCGPLRPRRWFGEVRRQGAGYAAGVPTDRFRTSLRVDLMLEDLIATIERVPGAAVMLPPGSVLPSASARRALAFALRGSSAEIHVARGDGTVRTIDARGAFRVPPDRRDEAGGLAGGGFSLSLALRDVGPRRPIGTRDPGAPSRTTAFPHRRSIPGH